MITIGNQLPDLELEAFLNNEFIKIKLREQKNKWLILFFYPADFTFVCPTELEELADHYQEFIKLKTEVMSVSTDTIYAHKAWHDVSEAVKKISFPMLADPAGKLCQALGTYIPEEGTSWRGTFIFDPQGVLKAIEMNDNSIGRSAAELLRKLQAAIYVSEHPGQACPASWQPGSKTLTPGIDLVGKI